MYATIKRLFENEGPNATVAKVTEIFKKKKTKITDISLRGIWESIVGDPSKTTNFLKNSSGFFGDEERVTESAVKQSALSNIIGVLLANEFIEQYNAVKTIGDQLCTLYKSSEKDERIAGFTAMQDGDEVEEAEDYPEFGISDKYVTTSEKKKRGGIVHVTEEAILRDKTGQLLENIMEIAEYLAMRKEKNIISGVVGGHQCYYPLGVATSLYATTPYKVDSNALVDWTDIEKCENDGLTAMVNENGEKIDATPIRPVILVPKAREWTAKRIVNATEISHYTETAIIETRAKNPLAGQNILVLTSVYVSTYAGNSTSWFYGDPKRQFRYKQIWPLQVFSLPANNIFEFTRDIKFSYKVREWGWIFAKDQKYFVKNNE